MNNWQNKLRNEMKKAHKIVVLGAGSILCGDDAAGMIVAKRLKELCGENSRVLSIEGSTAPECFTGVIRDYSPELLILIDAAHILGEVGDIKIIPLDEIKGLNFSTHMLPFNIVCDYLRAEINCKIVVLGIKPERVDFGTEASEKIFLAANNLAEEIYNNL